MAIQDEIAKLYQEVFGREADAEGLNYWTQQANSGALDIAGVRSNLETSPEAVLRSAYEHELGRKADEEGLAYWQDQIAQGNLTPEQAVQSIDASAESQGKIDLYNDLLGKGYTLDQMAQAVGNEYTINDIEQWAINNQLALPNQPAANPIDPAAALSGAIGRTTDLMNWTPERITGATATSQGYTPETIAGQDMSKYMNPYTQQVIDASMADLERQRQMQTNNLGFGATQARAFGGSRHGVNEALTNEAFARQGGQMAANLRQSGYGQALQTAGQDVASMNQAGMFGAGAANQAALANAGYAQQANIANQNIGLAGAQLNMNAANQLGNLGNLGFTQQRTLNQDMYNQGLAQQQMYQNLINSGMQQYQNWQGFPATSLGYAGTALGGFSTPTTQTTSPNYSVADYAGMALSLFPYL